VEKEYVVYAVARRPLHIAPPRHELECRYEQAYALVFPSKLETWGLGESYAASTGATEITSTLPALTDR